MALVLERLFKRRAEQPSFQLGSTIATAEVGQADGRLRVELPVEHGHQGFTHVLDDLRAAGGADGSQQFARVAVEHQGRRHGRAWAFARLYAVGYRLAVFCGDEREVGHLVVEQKFDEKVLVESAVQGREIECAVLGNDQPIASGCGEIVVSSGFYSYDSKYIDGQAAQVVVPAAISHDASERIRSLAIEAFEVLGCAGLARVDVFLTQDGEVLINEINSLPGFTRISMYPKLWQAAGMSYSELVSRLIELALERYAGRKGLKINRQ